MLAAQLRWQRELRRADALVAATAAHFGTSTQIPVDIPPQRRHVIPYGMDFSALQLTEHTAALADELRARTGQRKLVFALGRHVSYKGFDVLIDAMRQVDAVLMLGGSGPLTQQLRQQAQAQGVADRILFIGRIPEPDLAAYFQACDLFCLPSVSEMEAFGLVQLEAMACGKPVVCTQLNNGVNVVNVHGETGLAVPVGDALALGRTLMQLIDNDTLRTRMGQQAFGRAHGVYSLSAMTTLHVNLYRQLCDAPDLV
ncbi:glycosyltransferase [Ramlibacter sp. 2FC]|uniref:glycosyltransferase n=1 Tax=Ramlibacter sp. 2FC TaxID=2502188 RepID=UPI0010F7E22C|nr:glycosyltransferase [Ramlibacter sp. 2FC]